MQNIENPKHVIIASGSEKNSAFLCDSLKSFGFFIEVVSNAASLRRNILENNSDIIIIDAPLKDESGTDLAVNITDKTNAFAILIVKNEYIDRIIYKLRQNGVIVLGKPLNKEILVETVYIASAACTRINQIQQKTIKLQNKLDELKYISRAKIILMEKLSFSEEDAHHHIEKQSMDLRKSKKDIAMNIIRAYQ